MPATRVPQLPRGCTINAVPNREVEKILRLGRKRFVERGEHRRRIVKIRAGQSARTDRIQHRDREQRGADTVAAHVEQINCEMVFI